MRGYLQERSWRARQGIRGLFAQSQDCRTELGSDDGVNPHFAPNNSPPPPPPPPPPQAALQSLQKKVGRAEEMEQENLKIHQINLNLTGELEDYRNQTKTLLADLRAREEELTRERETQMQSGGSGQFTSSGVG